MTTLDNPRIPEKADSETVNSNGLTPRIGSFGSNEFYRQARNRVANVRELAAEIMDLDPSEGEEFFAEYQLKAGDLRLQMDALDKLFESEMYARLPPNSAGPR